jgi:DNA-binding response OmpR family regulator
MHVFVTHRNKVLTRHELLQAVWGCLKLFVNQLRRNIEPNTQHPALSGPIFMKSLAFLYEFFMRIRLS